MRIFKEIMLAAALLTVGATTGQPQAATGTAPITPADRTAAQQAPNVSADLRTEKQRALARQAERLFDMATELKVQVDKTNKNILSLKVVEKAEEIEALAKGMKDQAKR